MGGFTKKAPSKSGKPSLTAKDFLHMQDKVIKWNELAGNVIPKLGRAIDLDLVKTYRQLSHEEVFGKNELLQGFEENDLEMIADGLCDCVFTVFMWAALDRTPLDPKRDLDWLEKVERRDEVIVNDNDDPKNLADHLGKDVKEDDAFSAQTHLIILLQTMNTKIDVMAAFEKVCESNYSKFPLTCEVPDPLEECKLIEKKGRYVGITCKTLDEGRRYVFLANAEVCGDKVKAYGKPKIVKSRQFVDVQDLETTIRK